MAVGAGVAVADGSFPIGNIIGVVVIAGSTAWMDVDVYKATKVLPTSLAKTLDSLTRDSECQCRDEVRHVGENIV